MIIKILGPLSGLGHTLYSVPKLIYYEREIIDTVQLGVIVNSGVEAGVITKSTSPHLA